MRKLQRRRLRKKDIIKRRILITTLLFSLTFILVIGYSVFSTAINLSAKGNIYKVSDKCYEAKDNGDGTVTITDYDKTCGNEINIPSTIKGLTVTKINNGGWSNQIGFYGPFYNKGLTSVIIPDTITVIGDDAFVDNNIAYLKLGKNVQKIGTEAFASNNLTALTLPNSLTSIGTRAFGSNNLTSIDIPSSVTYLGGGSFANNNFKEEDAFIYGRNSDGSINYEVLDSCAVKNGSNLTLPNVKTISSNACRGVYFKNLTIPSSVEQVGFIAFSGNNAQTLTLNEGIKIIEGQAFENGNYKEITIPNSVEGIDFSAFRNAKLIKVTIGAGVTRIDDTAFISNPDLKTININKAENSVAGSPWGAPNATINWLK